MLKKCKTCKSVFNLRFGNSNCGACIKKGFKKAKSRINVNEYVESIISYVENVKHEKDN